MRGSLSVIALTLGVAGAVMAADVPRPAPSFSINLPSGKKLPLEQYRGKVVAFAFISTT